VNSLRLWILVLAVVSFGAGVAAGALVSVGVRRTPVQPGPFAEYEQDLVRTFDLGPERARILHTFLANYQREIEQIKDRQFAETMAAVEPTLSERGRLYRDLIRDKVLPADRRAGFEGAAFAITWKPAR